MADALSDAVSAAMSMPLSAKGMRGLKLTPQEMHLYEHHLRELKNPVRNSDGSYSTIRQMTVEQDGRTYSIPTVWGGKIL